jgi:hypothetical protein
MAKNVFDYQHTPSGPLPDISEFGTTRLPPLQHTPQTTAQWIAGHEAEIVRLVQTAEAVEQAVIALFIRVHKTADQTLREALEHNRADLQRFQDELTLLVTEHQRAIDQLHRTV